MTDIQEVPDELEISFLDISSELIAFANILAIEVFPTPRPPQKINECGIESLLIKLCKIKTELSCPITSSNDLGLYFLAKTICDMFLSGWLATVATFLSWRS